MKSQKLIANLKKRKPSWMEKRLLTKIEIKKTNDQGLHLPGGVVAIVHLHLSHLEFTSAD